jgi:hypothetical protein
LIGVAVIYEDPELKCLIGDAVALLRHDRDIETIGAAISGACDRATDAPQVKGGVRRDDLKEGKAVIVDIGVGNPAESQAQPRLTLSVASPFIADTRAKLFSVEFP